MERGAPDATVPGALVNRRFEPGPAWAVRLFVAALATGLAGEAASEAPLLRPTETEVKAAYLFNLARFVDWPAWSFDSPGSPFIIGVLGDDLMTETLRATLEGKTVRGRPVAVEQWRRAEDVRAHILFIGAQESFVLPRVLRQLDDRPILTVGDMDAFAERGGMVSFVLERRHVRFDVNHERVQRAGLQMSSQVLKLARRLTSDEG